MGNDGVVKLLLEQASIDVKVRDKHGMTALDLAQLLEREAITAEILKHSLKENIAIKEIKPSSGVKGFKKLFQSTINTLKMQ